MKKSLKIVLIILAIIILLVVIFLIKNIYGLGFYDRYMFNKAIKTGDVKYCNKILDYAIAPGRRLYCVELLAQLNDDSSICEKIHNSSPYLSSCYALYAYYKNDESLCVEPQCSVTLFNTCKRVNCETIDDYK